MSKRKPLDLPKHKNPIDEQGKLISSRTACAPYNFVPLPDQVVLAVKDAKELPDHDTYSNEGYPHTGYYDVMMKTKSPLYIRSTLTRDEFDLDEQDKDRNGREVNNQTRYADRIKNTPHFFYTNDPAQPIIPGSSLRGMLRGFLEIVSYGKVGPVSDSLRVTFRAVAAAKDDPLTEPYRNVIGKFGRNVCAGYLVQQNDNWYIRPAKKPSDLKLPDQDAYLKVKDRYIPNNAIPDFIGLNSKGYKPHYYKVTFDKEIRKGKRGSYTLVTKIGSSQSNYPFRGALVCSGNMLETGSGSTESPRKNHALVLDPKEATQLLKLRDQVISDYVGALTPFLMEPPFDKQNGCLENGRPVFYVEHQGEVICFGHCPNFRVPAFWAKETRSATPLDFTPPELRRIEEIDYAEALFGYVKGNSVNALQGSKTRAYAGRIFITDATTMQTDVWLSQAPITAKILASPKPTTFQHYLAQSSNSKHSLKHYGSSSPIETVIRGHKLYWHQDDRTAQQLQPNPEYGELEPTPTSTQHTQFKPVKPGVTFSFRIYFENLSDEELGALCWALYPLGDGKKEYCHSLGMGKPLGMGAVKLDAVLHLNKREARYGSLFDGNGWMTGFPEDDQRLADHSELVKKFTDAFEKRILNELEPFQKDGKPVACSRLANLKRIGMFLKMMEWPGFPANLPATRDNRSETPAGKPNTRYMTIELKDVPSAQKNEYKDRPVLPDPSADIFGGLTGYAEPSAGKDEPTASEPHTSDSKSAGEADKSEATLSPAETKQAVPKETAKIESGKDESLTLPTASTVQDMAIKHSTRTNAQSEKSKPSQEIHPATLKILEDLKKTEEKPQQEQAVKTITAESVVFIAYINPKKARVRSEQGEEVECSAMPGYPKLQASDSFRALVTRQDGKASSAVFDGWK